MKLYNTLTRSKELFVPIEDNTVKVYTCGPTVYDYAHIGNLRTYIHEDVLHKALEYFGYNVKRVMNITDVGHLESDSDDGEDKMLKGARRENKTVWEVAQYYADAFFEDINKLNIKKPEIIEKATDHIEDYIEFIRVLEKKGYTYIRDGNVYFDISKVDDYTKLSGMNLDELQVALRDDVEIDVNKKNPQDFVLWFTKSKFGNQMMKWESPWGTGYPGWHIECSVIAHKYLGENIDIHCGGVDHIPVHHTNEIAQTEAYTGEKWVNTWWHGEFLLDKEGKMSKSKNEFLTISLLEEKGYDPLAYRYYVLNSHYRKQLAFTFDSLDMASTAYEKLKRKTISLKDKVEENDKRTSNSDQFREKFKLFLEDDLNTANAITVVFEVLKSNLINNLEKYKLVENFDRVLSLNLLNNNDTKSLDVDEEEIEELINKRNEAKKAKDFAKADEIRDELKRMGIKLEDTPDGVNWSFVK